MAFVPRVVTNRSFSYTAILGVSNDVDTGLNSSNAVNPFEQKLQDLPSSVDLPITVAQYTQVAAANDEVDFTSLPVEGVTAINTTQTKWYRVILFNSGATIIHVGGSVGTQFLGYAVDPTDLVKLYPGHYLVANVEAGVTIAANNLLKVLNSDGATAGSFYLIAAVGTT